MNALGSTPTLLRLRHVPGDEGLDRRSGRAGVDAGRAAQLRPEVGHEQLSRHRRGSSTRTRICRGRTCRATSRIRSAASAARATGWIRYADYGGEVGGPILKNKWWGWGSLGADRTSHPDAAGHSRQDHADRRERQDQRAVLAEVARQLHVLQRQQAEGRPRRRPVQSAGDDVHPERPVEALQGRGELRRASNSLFLTARFAHVNGPFSLTPKGGLDKQVFVDADGVYHNTNLFLDTNRPQKTVDRGRQLVPRPPRGEVRRLVPPRGRRDDSRATATAGSITSRMPNRASTLAMPFRNYLQNTRARLQLAVRAATRSR